MICVIAKDAIKSRIAILPPHVNWNESYPRLKSAFISYK